MSVPSGEGQMKITRIKDGLWDIGGGRGKLERTPQGAFYISLNNPGEQWSEAEKAQIEQFKENLDYEVDRDWR